MRKTVHGGTVLGLLLAGAICAARPTPAAGAERYLHVKVEDARNGENVNVNVPLSMAEKILPAINNRDLHEGRVTIHGAEMNGVDLRTLLDAVRTAPDNEFVTVKERRHGEVRVAKSKGNIIVHFKDPEGEEETVDVTVPMKVIDALLATAKDDELDVASALRALSDVGDILLVTAEDGGQKVRVWVDSHNAAQ